MSDKIIENNQVSIMGKVASGFTFQPSSLGEGFYTLEVLVKRLSDSEDRIPLMISERLVDITQDYEGVYTVFGQFRSYNRHEERRTGWYFRYLSGNWDSSRKRTILSKQIRFSWMDTYVSLRFIENSFRKGNSRLADRSKPAIWEIRLYTVYLLGTKCQICFCISGWQSRTDMGTNPEQGICKRRLMKPKQRKEQLMKFLSVSWNIS